MEIIVAIIVVVFVGLILKRAGQKRCPFCRESFNRGATVCPHCQKDI